MYFCVFFLHVHLAVCLGKKILHTLFLSWKIVHIACIQKVKFMLVVRNWCIAWSCLITRSACLWCSLVPEVTYHCFFSSIKKKSVQVLCYCFYPSCLKLIDYTSSVVYSMWNLNNLIHKKYLDLLCLIMWFKKFPKGKGTQLVPI